LFQGKGIPVNGIEKGMFFEVFRIALSTETMLGIPVQKLSRRNHKLERKLGKKEDVHP